MSTKTRTLFSSQYRSMLAALTELRHKRGMSQYDLAQKLGWDRLRLQRIEDCAQTIDPLELHLICLALGEDASAIYRDFVESLDKPDKTCGTPKESRTPLNRLRTCCPNR